MSDAATERSEQARNGSWRRPLVAFAALSAAALFVVVAFVAYAASHLERVVAHPRVKRMLAEHHVTVSLASGHAGAGALELHGLEVRITKARKNAPVTTIALPLFRAEYALGSLLFSSRNRVARVEIEGLSVEAMRYVRDDEDPAKGTDDVDDDDDSEPPALARGLVALGRAPVSLGALEVRALTFIAEQRSLTTGKVTRSTVSPLAANASLDAGTLTLRVGDAASPLRTTIGRTVDGKSSGQATVATSFELAVRPGGVLESSFVVDLEAQDLEPRAPAKAKLATGKIHATTSEAAGEVHVDTFAVSLADGLVAVDADVVHRDTQAGGVVVVPSATLQLHAERLPELLASSVAARVVVTDAEPVVLTAKNLRFGPHVTLGTDSSVALQGAVRALELRLADAPIVLRGLVASGAVAFAASGEPSGRLALGLERFEAPGDLRATKGELALEASPVAGTTNAKGVPPVDLAARVSLAETVRGRDRVAGLDLRASARLAGVTLERPSLEARLANVTQGTAQLAGVQLNASGPAKLVWGTKGPFDTTSASVLRVTSIATPGAAVKELDLRVTTAGTSAATTFDVEGHATEIELQGLEGKRARSGLSFSLEPSAPLDIVASKPALPTVRARAEAFGATLRGEATPRGRGAEVELHAEVPSFAPLAAFVPSSGVTLCARSLARASLRAKVRGAVSSAVVPAGELSLVGVELCNAPTAVSVHKVDLRWPETRPSTGGAFEGALEGVELAGDGVSRGATFAVRGERRGPRSGALAVDVVGRKLPDLHLSADASFEAREKRLAFSIDARVANVEALPPSLRSAGPHGVDALASIELSAQGATVGLIERWDDAGLALAPGAFTNSTGQGEVHGGVEGLRLHGDKGAKVAVDRFGFEGSIAKTGRALTARTKLSGDGLEAESVAGGGRVMGLEAALDVSSPDGEKIDARARVAIADAQSRGKARVSLGKVAFAVDAQGSRSEAIGITRLEASSSGLGTSFEASGSVDLRPRTAPVGFGDVVVVGRESAYLRGVLTADLAALTASVDGLGAKGQVRAPLVIAAGDRSLVRVDGTVELRNVSVDWGSGRVEGVDGRVPVDEELRLEGDRVRLVPLAANAFSRERFEDQQPLVAGASFVRVKRLAFGEQVVGPLGASVRIERNTLALERLELAALGGSVGGRVFVDLRGLDTRVDFRGDVTGLAVAADKKPLDAHVAIRLKPWRRALDGRVDVARTSPDQMRLMLDLYDPYQENVSANRARQALALGYPKSMRMRFQDGLASVAIDLGGLGAAVRIDEIRGVPIAPMLEKSLLPKLPKEPPRL